MQSVWAAGSYCLGGHASIPSFWAPASPAGQSDGIVAAGGSVRAVGKLIGTGRVPPFGSTKLASIQKGLRVMGQYTLLLVFLWNRHLQANSSGCSSLSGAALIVLRLQRCFTSTGVKGCCKRTSCCKRAWKRLKHNPEAAQLQGTWSDLSLPKRCNTGDDMHQWRIIDS